MSEAQRINSVYDDDFYDYISSGSTRSAEVIFPELFRHFHPNSVCDIGCGRGAWLAVLEQLGISDYLGVDGAYVERDRLLIPSSRFIARDLSSPFKLGRKFDLVISLEVGEHIPPKSADFFVDNLCAHSEAVLFSAAVPGQGGESHVNEQPYAYWRDKFAQRGYRLFDFLRPKIRSDRRIEPYYRYNALFFARATGVERLSAAALSSEVKPDKPVAERAPFSWRLRNALIGRLPPDVSEQLMRLKQWYVRQRSSRVK